MSGRDIIGSRNCPLHGWYRIAGTDDDPDHRDCEPRPEPRADADAARRDAVDPSEEAPDNVHDRAEDLLHELIDAVGEGILSLETAVSIGVSQGWAAGRRDAFEQAKSCGWEGCNDDGHEH